ncbi:hypothetical protein G9A89_017454 [Geosiphon pyriformis]|nr:hypothetical protein G9A89_017454 [Geosiphon pyriformis]
MSNQLGKMTNTQFEELQTQITQVILEKKIQEIIQEEKLKKTDVRKQYWYTLTEDIIPEESSTIKLSKQSTKLWFQETTDKLLPLNLCSLYKELN